MEKTFIILKPDAVQRGLVGEILGRFERRGLKLVAMKFLQVSDELARKHYAVHAERPFFAGLVQYITSSPVVALVLEGTNAITVVRSMVGATRPHEAASGTIRADFGLEVGRNLVHASDGPDTAKDEIALWFGEELVGWNRATDPWIYE
ncbi:MAG TPA: nucleoside-diphosphate kinase [Caldilineaceae bacterium]|nr:nucleoside-diphosphate kinase [Caldilineaceae bacterium]